MQLFQKGNIEKLGIQVAGFMSQAAFVINPSRILPKCKPQNTKVLGENGNAKLDAIMDSLT